MLKSPLRHLWQFYALRMTNKQLGIYVHIPFCISKCAYCDFASFGGSSKEGRRTYIDALLSEIEEYGKEKKSSPDTVYFGGGTPSILEVSEISLIVNKLSSVFDLSKVREFTIEANPGTVSFEKLCAYKKLGFNRISFGLQSIHENELKMLGRIHTYREFEDAYYMARKAGFDNINVDLMYSIPGQSRNSFAESLNKVISLSPEHISAYSLIIEEGTPIYKRRHSLSFPDENEEIEMYNTLCNTLANAGYSHYEISNYAKAGFETLHNLIYWHMDEYVGFGLSAHSYYGGTRISNTASLKDYILNPSSHTKASLTRDDEAFEYAMLALRLKEGFSLSDYKSRFGVDFISGREEKLKTFIGGGFLKIENGRIFLTEKGFYVSNALLVELL